MGMTFSKNTSVYINIIRILACGFVMMGHGFSFFQISIFKNQDVFCYIQNIGVVLLLLLAGFLLPFSIDRRLASHYRFRDFYVDKACRLIIPLFFALILTFLIDGMSSKFFPLAQAETDSRFGTFVGNMLMLQLYPVFGLRVPCFGSAAQLWTLSIEWWFFIAVGFLYLVLIPQFNGKFSLVSLAAFAVMLYMLLEYSRIGIVPNAPWMLMIGFGVYYGFKFLKDRNKPLLWAFSMMCLVSAVICGLTKKNAYDYWFVISIGLALLFSLSATQGGGGRTETKSDRIVAYLSKYTYSLYLVHYPIFDLFYRKWLTDQMKDGGWLLFYCVVLSNVIAILLYLLIERNTPTIAKFIKRKI